MNIDRTIYGLLTDTKQKQLQKKYSNQNFVFYGTDVLNKTLKDFKWTSFKANTTDNKIFSSNVYNKRYYIQIELKKDKTDTENYYNRYITITNIIVIEDDGNIRKIDVSDKMIILKKFDIENSLFTLSMNNKHLIKLIDTLMSIGLVPFDKRFIKLIKGVCEPVLINIENQPINTILFKESNDEPDEDDSDLDLDIELGLEEVVEIKKPKIVRSEKELMDAFDELNKM